MSALLGRGLCQKLYLYSVGLNSQNFAGVNYFRFCQSYIRGATRVVQTAWIGSPDKHERRLNTVAGGPLPGHLVTEHKRCVADQAVVSGDRPGASMVSVILPIHQRPNGVVHGSFLVEQVIQMATIAVNRYCSQHSDTKEQGGNQNPAFCFLSSFDGFKYIQPLKFSDMMRIKANVSATSDHLLLVDVSIERNTSFIRDAFQLANTAQLSFITNNHPDFSRRYGVTSQKAYTEELATVSLLQALVPSNDQAELIPNGSVFTFVLPYDCMPPEHLHCRPGHVSKLMEDQGIILASRFVQHDVVCVHVDSLRYHENVKMGNIALTHGKVVSTTENVLTVFLTVSLLCNDFTKPLQRCVAEGFFSYVPINSAKERVSVSSHQILSGHDHSLIQDKGFGIDHNIVDNYVSALKNL